jgi:hypothetical protein
MEYSTGALGTVGLPIAHCAKNLNFNAKSLEASPGIEPGYKDLQSSASPLRHEAIRERVVLWWRGFRMIQTKPQEVFSENIVAIFDMSSPSYLEIDLIIGRIRSLSVYEQYLKAVRYQG